MKNVNFESLKYQGKKSICSLETNAKLPLQVSLQATEKCLMR